MSELIKRFINLVVCWSIIAILPAFSFFACLFLFAYRVVCGDFPSIETERFFKMLVFGQEGCFDLREDEELEIELEYEDVCPYCDDEGCSECEG
jgi:hypothetical protein